MIKFIERPTPDALAGESIGRIIRQDYRDTLTPKADAMLAAKLALLPETAS
jgi:hypothetical protein